MDAIGAVQPPLPVSLALGMKLDPRVLPFTLVVSMGTGIVFGLLPARGATRAGLIEALCSTGSGAAVSMRATSWSWDKSHRPC